MDTSILEDLGLTNAEIKVYLALLELGTSTAGPIIQKTNLQNSVTHMTLHKLTEKGFITFITKGKIKHYSVTDPKNILKFIDEKRERFEKILPELLIKQHGQEKQQAEIFIGFKGFKNAYYELLKDAKKGDEFRFFAFETSDKEQLKIMYKFFYDLSLERKRRKIISKGITGVHMREVMRGRDPKEILFVNFPVPKNVTICNDKIIFNAWEDGQINLLVHSRQLAQNFKEYHESIWKKYKK